MSSEMIALLADVLVSASLFVIAHKSEHPLKWLALVPLANLWLMCDMADVPIYYLLVYLVPVLGLWLFLGVYVWLWMRISENTNKPQWLGLLMLIPFVNVAVAGYMAFYEPAEIV